MRKTRQTKDRETHAEALETTRAVNDTVNLAMRVDVGAAGEFEGMASVQGSIANGAKGPVTFKYGAFRETLSEKGGVFPLLWQHEDSKPIGKVTLTETAEGLKAFGQITQNTTGKEITELLRDGVPLGLSIGFNPIEAAYEKHAGTGTMIRCVSKARLKETSIVTFPADPAATIRVVHSAVDPIISTNVEVDDQAWVREVVNTVVGETEDTEIHAGRVFSERNLSRMRTTAETLLDLIAMADPSFAPSVLPKYRPEPEASAPDDEFSPGIATPAADEPAEGGDSAYECECGEECECEGDCNGQCPDCDQHPEDSVANNGGNPMGSDAARAADVPGTYVDPATYVDPTRPEEPAQIDELLRREPANMLLARVNEFLETHGSGMPVIAGKKTAAQSVVSMFKHGEEFDRTGFERLVEAEVAAAEAYLGPIRKVS